MRGEKSFPPLMLTIISGSPPRARGEVPYLLLNLRPYRITPACAGRSWGSRCSGCPLWDHPRVRGEKAEGVRMIVGILGSPPRARGEAPEWKRIRKSTGSPPRARGEVVLTIGTQIVERITPACAGRRSISRIPENSDRDHPRVRGEKYPRWALLPSAVGSPPRARGEGRSILEMGEPVGITPACAGRRTRMRPLQRELQDHPRVRGEKPEIDFVARNARGSPPRARGEGSSAPTPRIAIRITPACAGRSCCFFRSAPSVWDHPRVRGEKVLAWDLPQIAGGSPPRARGEVRYIPTLYCNIRITPACAGRSWTRTHERTRNEDHPRVRGEKRQAGTICSHRRGSPPRARGEDGRVPNGRPMRGITPACAGRRLKSTKPLAVSQDHPRVRGEKRVKIQGDKGWTGSPPRARGEVG